MEINGQDEDGQTLLISLIINPINVVENTMKRVFRCELNLVDSEEKRYKDVENLLLNPSTDINIKDNLGNTAVDYTLIRWDFKILKLIVKHKSMNINSFRTDLLVLSDRKYINCVLKSKIDKDKLLSKVFFAYNKFIRDTSFAQHVSPDIQKIIDDKISNISFTMKSVIYYGANANNNQNDISQILPKWWLYLPEWSKVNHKLYPSFLKKEIKIWLLVNKRIGKFPKDIIFLIISYIANNIGDDYKF